MKSKNKTQVALLIVATLFLLVGLPIAFCGCDAQICENLLSHPVETLVLLSTGLIGMTVHTHQVKDKTLSVTKALPNGAASIVSDGIQVKSSTNAKFHAPCELFLEAPALSVSALPNTETMIYDIEHDDASDFSGVATLQAAVLTQTGSGGAGDAAAELRFKLPTTVKKYVRVKATNSGSGNASAVSLTASLLF